MRRLLAIAVPAVLLLLAPASAPAKGIVGATVCGADGCRQIPNAGHGILEGGPQVDAPARAEPFVRLNIKVGVPGHVEPVRLLFLPGSELMLGDDGTTWMAPMAVGELQAIARRVEPFPGSKLPASAPLGTAAPAGSGGPLAPEVFDPAAQSAASDGDFDAWWLAVPAAAIVLAAGAVLALRRRRDPPPAAARAVGS